MLTMRMTPLKLRIRMLYLNRKADETIEIKINDTGEVINLVVLEVKGKVVRLGFANESRSCTILRKEVRQRKEGHDNPNPYYQDKIPHWWKKKETPAPAQDGVEEYVENLFNNTEDTNSAVAEAA